VDCHVGGIARPFAQVNDNVSAIDYSNFTNDAYKVQFQYAFDSLLIDDVRQMVMIISNSTGKGAVAMQVSYVIDFKAPQLYGTTDLQVGTNKAFDELPSMSEYQVLDYMLPWFTSIYSHKAGTFMVTTKRSDISEDTMYKDQNWR
jgi:hypothetical protein